MLRSQFVSPKMLLLDQEEFLDDEKGLDYLLGEMDKQAKEEPIVKLEVEEHNQEHLESWKHNKEEFTTLN